MVPNKETQIFREYWDPRFPDIMDLIKKCPMEFKQIADSGKGVVVMSFGSVAHAEMMPEQWKTAFLNAFAQYPEHEFVIKYANDDLKRR
ncbi:hypothetical protein ANCCEY_12918 [Ancylostoma ceylanicum]|uniref:glucuronosyltransferase n=1 Tax=Ancylostoma ceylanicum TaxID=53326 RepID=A0A0D6L868_9BILA|nr:hypothetical protein ANCCEY_12918 [Ancylostoma ceylanicum]